MVFCQTTEFALPGRGAKKNADTYVGVLEIGFQASLTGYLRQKIPSLMFCLTCPWELVFE